MMGRTDLALPPGLYGNGQRDKHWQRNQGQMGEGVTPCWAFNRSSSPTCSLVKTVEGGALCPRLREEPQRGVWTSSLSVHTVH